MPQINHKVTDQKAPKFQSQVIFLHLRSASDTHDDDTTGTKSILLTAGNKGEQAIITVRETFTDAAH